MGMIVTGVKSILIDEPVPFLVHSLETASRVDMCAEYKSGGKVMKATAAFLADKDGVVDPSTMPSIEGTYRGIDGWGLHWSPEPVDGWPTFADSSDVYTDVTVTCAGQLSTSFHYARMRIRTGVQRVDVDDDTLVATWFRPVGPGPFPGCLVLGGSEGGIAPSESLAAVLASRGIAALAVAYFGLPRLPVALREIPLEYLYRAIRWLLGQEEVKGPGVGVFGTSRGGELALLLGATFPEINGVVASVGSGVVWPGFDSDGSLTTSAWSHKDQPIPCVQRRPDATAPILSTDADGGADFHYGLDHLSATELDRVTIATERTNGPILLLSGIEDTTWPSTTLSEIALQRARTNNFPHQISHFAYPDAGHSCIRFPGTAQRLSVFHPVLGRTITQGGTRSGNAAASIHAWPKIVEFLGGDPDQLPFFGVKNPL